MERSNPAHRVLIVGLNYGSILTMVRDLGKAEYEIEIVRVFKKEPSRLNLLGRMKPEAESRYVKAHHTLVMEGDSARLRDALLELRDENAGAMTAGCGVCATQDAKEGASDTARKTLLLPVDDFLVEAVDEHYDALSEYFVIPNVSEKQGAIAALMRKDRQKKLAERVGLNTAKSVKISLKKGEYAIPDDTPFPCFIKPNASSRGTKLMMKRSAVKEELEEALRPYISEDGASILCERYIDIREEYSLLGLSAGGRVIIPGLFRAGLHGHRERKGVAITGTVMDTSAWSGIIDKACRLVLKSGYTGMFDLDFVEDKNGEIFFTEMNFRAGASVHAFSEEGVNLPAAFADCVLKGAEPGDIGTVSRAGRCFVSEKALLEEYVRSDIDRKTMNKSLNEADIFFIRDEEDPAPYAVFRKYLRAAGLFRLPYRLRDRMRDSKR